MVRAALMVTGYFLLKQYTDLSLPTLLALVFVSIIVLRRIGAMKGGGRIVIWTFVEQRRARRMAIRKYARIGLLLLLAFIMMALLFIPAFTGNASADTFMKWVTWILPSGIACILGIAIWAILDRPKTRIRNGPGGWIQISGAHPEALGFLRGVERKADENTPGKRLVRTIYLHRYPLGLLIGKHWKRPLLVINIVLLKLLRSPFLVREAYHFSEAENIDREQLVAPLKDAVDSWLTTHPEWSFVSGEHLPAPAGDLHVESAILASPGFETCALVTRSWMQQKPSDGSTQHSFCNWLADGSVISTVDHATLKLSIPGDQEIRVSGTPEQVYQAHLEHCAGKPVHPAGDIPEILSRFHHKREQADRLVTEKRLQSEVREVCPSI